MTGKYALQKGLCVRLFEDDDDDQNTLDATFDLLLIGTASHVRSACVGHSTTGARRGQLECTS